MSRSFGSFGTRGCGCFRFCCECRFAGGAFGFLAAPFGDKRGPSVAPGALGLRIGGVVPTGGRMLMEFLLRGGLREAFAAVVFGEAALEEPGGGAPVIATVAGLGLVEAIEEESAVALAGGGEGFDDALMIVLPAGEGRGGDADEGGGCGIGEAFGDALAD